MPSVRSHTAAHSAWLGLMDLACLAVGSIIGVLVRFGPDEMTEYVFRHVDGWLLLFASVLLANYLAGSYKVQYTFSRFNLLVTWLFSIVFALLILSMTSYAWFRIILGRGVLFISLAAYSALSLFLKLAVYRNLFRSEIFLCRTVILGVGERAGRLRKMLENAYVLPAHKVVAYVQVVRGPDQKPAHDGLRDGVALLESHPDELLGLIRSLDVSLVVVGLDEHALAKKIYPQLRRLRFENVEVLSGLTAAELYSGRTPVDLIDEEYLMQATLESGFPAIRQLKRTVDIVVSLTACVLCLPLAALIAVLIKVSEPRSPVLYSQMRVGHFGRIFRIYKFRTMREGAEDETGPVWSAADDARITRIGRFLRRFRLDELPQFLNILRGEMSLVGPRPERPELAAELEKTIRFYNERQNVVPGLTGWAQIQFPYGWSVEDAVRKLEYDLYYIKHLSLSLDLQIALRSIRIVLFGKERSV